MSLKRMGDLWNTAVKANILLISLPRSITVLILEVSNKALIFIQAIWPTLLFKRIPFVDTQGLTRPEVSTCFGKRSFIQT